MYRKRRGGFGACEPNRWKIKKLDELDGYQRYTDAICQTVYFRHRQGVAQEIVAVFLINTESATL